MKRVKARVGIRPDNNTLVLFLAQDVELRDEIWATLNGLKEQGDVPPEVLVLATNDPDRDSVLFIVVPVVPNPDVLVACIFAAIEQTSEVQRVERESDMTSQMYQECKRLLRVLVERSREQD